ncbi:MAG: hypothetical protein IKJ27_10690 [Clostridia bacterium]|nr:hypothetical protein [Clostridia bacterium]
MDIIKNLRCIMYLVKCSKYLYFAKKLVCFMTILISAAVLLSLAGDGRETIGRLKGIL